MKVGCVKEIKNNESMLEQVTKSISKREQDWAQDLLMQSMKLQEQR